MKIAVNDMFHFGKEIRIGNLQVIFAAVGLQGVLGQDSLYGRATDRAADGLGVFCEYSTLRLKAGSIGPSADYRHTTVKSSSGSGVFWFRMYSFHTSSVTFPLVATQYPLAHRC